MIISKNLIEELQKRLKIGNRKGVHLNAIPKNSAYKFDITNLNIIEKNLATKFINTLLSERKFNFEISWRDIDIDLFTLNEKEQKKFLSLGKSFEKIQNQVETIKSEKGLETFGFGFPIIARRDVSDKKITVAPLVIWQLELKKSTKNDTWEVIKTEDSPIYINEVLINHLKADCNIDIDQISSEVLEDNLVNKEELFNICLDVLSKLNLSSERTIRENLTNVFETIVPIGSENEYESLAFNDRNSILKMSGLFSYFQIQKNNIIKEYDSLLSLVNQEIGSGLLEDNEFQSVTSIPTDPTQQGVLNSLEKTRNIVIQGPPGTGKSQTLSAILVNALENKKKCIVVCEKQTALNVLLESLKRKGLGDHITLINDVTTSRPSVISSSRNKLTDLNNLATNYRYSRTSYPNKIKDIKKIIEEINEQHNLLNEELLNDKNWTDVIGEYLSNTRESTIKLNLSRKSNLELNYDNYTRLLDLIKDGENLYNNLIDSPSLTLIKPEAYTANSIFEFEDFITDSFDKYKNIIQDIIIEFDNLLLEYKTSKETHFSESLVILNSHIENLASNQLKLEDLISTYKEKFINLENQNLQEEISSIEPISQLLESIIIRNIRNEHFLDDTLPSNIFYKIKTVFSKQKKETIEDQKTFKNEFKKLVGFSSQFKYLTTIENTLEIKQSIDQYKKFTKNKSDLIESFRIRSLSIFNDFDLNHLHNLKTFEELFSHIDLLLSRPNINFNMSTILKDLVNEIRETSNNQKITFISLNRDLKNSEYLNFELKVENNLIDLSNVLSMLNNKIENAKKTFETQTQLGYSPVDLMAKNDLVGNLNTYQKITELLSKLNNEIISDNLINVPKEDNIATYIYSIKTLLSEFENIFEKEKSQFTNIYEWNKFLNTLNENDRVLMDALIDSNSPKWEATFNSYFFNRLLLNVATDKHPKNEYLHNKYLNEVKDISQQQVDFINDLWYNLQLNEIKRFDSENELKVKNLYNLKKSKLHKKYTLRYIVKRDLDLFTTLFPIILTTPDVASNLFKDKNKYFDIVLFDEASQLRLEDTLPAMLKGKQIIISGDEHQMPPSNYFAKIYEGEIENEEEIEEDENNYVIDKTSLDSIALSCISLLEFATEFQFQTKHLNFHYRSKHPYLIDFSNYAFYRQRLKPLPNVHDYTPIKYINVNGIFENGVNELEAEMVISILENNIHKKENGKYPTVGIATSNLGQRNLIKTKINERMKLDKYKNFSKKIFELEENGLFVKNLENIQGDERDIMIISSVYGKNPDGKFYERFGPLNFGKGYKLLNVIITRAKYKNFIITSIPEEIIMNYKSYLITQGSNIKKAPLIPYLAYSKAVSEGNEDLRSDILTSLEANDPENIESRELYFESPFEKEVYERLIMEGIPQENLFTQYRVGGFRIDIVLDFKINGIPKIAIECDGAKYHSSNEAYLYDTHRQIILENQGFKFIRIWGTNWWRNADHETKILTEKIQSIKCGQINVFEASNILDGGFNDEIVSIEEIIPQTLEDESKSFELFESYENEKEIEQISTTPEKYVDLGDIVKIKFINDNTEMQFQIVEKSKRDKYISDDLKPLCLESPLGVAIKNKSVGDTAKIEGLDRFVEIVEIR